jgi:outer membrane receptor protein involved in Fe transport
MDSQQTRLFIEGVPLSDPAFQTGNLLLFPALSVGTVSLFPSSVPTQFMTDGMGGAINLKLSHPALYNRFFGRVGNLGLVKVAGQGRLSSQVVAHLGYFQSQENFKYLDNNGTPFNSGDDSWKERIHNGFKMFSILPVGEWKIQRGLKLTAFSLNGLQESEVPGSVYQPDFYSLTQFTNLTGAKTAISLGPYLDLEVLGFFRLQRDVLKPEKQSLGERLRDSRNTGVTSTGAQLSFRWFVAEELKINWGAGGRFSETLERKTDVEVPLSAQIDFKPTDSVNLQPSFVAQYLPGTSASKVKLSPRLGWGYQLSSNGCIRGFLGSVFRRPSLAELFGNSQGLESNPELQTETGLKSEVGTDWILARGEKTVHKLSYTLFAARVKNLIHYFPSSPTTRKPMNIGGASWVGQELQYEMQSLSGWTLRPSISWLNTQNESSVVSESGKQLPQRFPWRALFDFSYEAEGWCLGYRGSVYSKSFLDSSNQQDLAPYTIHDVFLGISFKKIGKLDFDVINLFDVTAVGSSQGGLQTVDSISGVMGYPVAGRRFGITWQAEI